MHSVAKIACKILATRLAPELPRLISASQSAFIKGRSIQDNFLYVQNVVKEAHSKNLPLLFLKLDIAKAFDSVNWGYLLDVLKGYGFGQRWMDLLAIMLSSSTSRVLLNGIPGTPFSHRQGLRQGNPLSPMLFILAMEPLQRMFAKATEEGILSQIKRKAVGIRTSMYADDAALFLNPRRHEVAATQRILRRFGDISGLMVNLEKCVAYKIKCNDTDHAQTLVDFGGSEGSLPCKYLGLPLSTRKPRQAEMQPILDKARARIKPWKGKLMNRTGRLALINSMLTAIATYYLTCFAADKWASKKLDKFRRSFLWAGEEEVSGGKCMVNWKQCCTPKKFGGLGIKNIKLYSRSLRLHWLWCEWDLVERPWKGTQVPCDRMDKALFDACTSITLGNGQISRFWHDRWLAGESPRDIAPDIFKLAWRKNLTVSEALTEGRWMRGAQRMSAENQIHQFISLWEKVQTV